MAIVIDNLQIEIQSESTKATSSLMRLIDTLKDLRSVCKGGAGLGSVVKQLERLNRVLNGQDISNSLGNVSRSAKKATENVKNYAVALREASQAQQEMSRNFMTNYTGVNSFNNGIQARIGGSSIPLLGGVSDVIDVEWKEVSSGVSQTGAAVSDLDSELERLNKELPFSKSSIGEVNQGNIDMLKSTLALQSPFGKLTGMFDKFTEGLNRAKSKASELFGALKRIAFYRFLRTILKDIAAGFEEGLTNSYQFSKAMREQENANSQLADSLDRIATKSNTMKNQIGSAISEIVIALEPLVVKLEEIITRFADTLSQVFAALNGDTVYKKALDTAKYWDDSTDAVKKYKQQLLGIDEINNLTSNSGGSSNSADDPTKNFKYSQIDDRFMAVAGIKEKLAKSLSELDGLIAGGSIGLGLLLTLSGANPILGLGMLAFGVYKGVKTIQEDWNSTDTKLSQKIADIEGIVGPATLAIGALLAFSGVKTGLGIGLMLMGGVASAASYAEVHWDTIPSKIKKKINKVGAIVGAASLALGAILTFTGVKPSLGIPMMLSGLAISAELVKLNWDYIEANIRGQSQKVRGLILGGAAVGLAVGALLAFTGHPGLGIAMMLASGGLAIAEITINWDSILQDLKTTWNKIYVWWNNTVINSVQSAVGWIEEQFGFDFNGDGKIGSNGSKLHINPNTNEIHGGSYGKFANGGVPTQGTMFFAGESGPEYVGNIGGATGVMNSDQMQDVLYGATYAAVSKALAENSGGFVISPDPDGIFNVVRKKQNEYNRRTGLAY